MKLKIVKFKSVRSTNDEAIKLIRSGKYRSGLISSDSQVKGRGTMGLRDPKSPASPQRLSGGGARTILQASSPDEVALVKYSNQTSLELIERDRTTV